MRKVINIIRKKLQSDIRPYDILILEYGIDRPKEMEFLISIIQPHISILTKLDAVHSLQFGDAHAIAHEELKLQKNTLLKCYINTSELLGVTLAKKLKTKIAYYSTVSSSQKSQSKNAISANHYIVKKNISPINNKITTEKTTNPVAAQSTLHF